MRNLRAVHLLPFLLLILSSFIGSTSFARPVAYSGATTSSLSYQSFLYDWDLIHSLNATFAIAARAMRIQTPTDVQEMFFPSIHGLVQRWNGEGWQSNLFFRAGYGWLQHRDLQGYAGMLGADADFETLRFYSAAKYDWMSSDHSSDQNLLQLRIGFAPFLAEFGDWAAWLVLQFQHLPHLREKQVITPMLRLYSQKFIIEAGMSLHGNVLSSLTVQF